MHHSDLSTGRSVQSTAVCSQTHRGSRLTCRVRSSQQQSASYMVLTIQVPNIVVALGVRRELVIEAFFRLSRRRVIRVFEETSSPPKTNDFARVSYGFCNLYIYPLVGSLALRASPCRAPLARRFGAKQAFVATLTARGESSAILRSAQQCPTYLFSATTT